MGKNVLAWLYLKLNWRVRQHTDRHVKRRRQYFDAEKGKNQLVGVIRGFIKGVKKL